MQRAPLAQNFAKWAWIGDFIGRDTCQAITGDISDAIATGLDAMHIHAGKQIHHIGRFFNRDPVILDVLPCGEVAVALREFNAFA